MTTTLITRNGRPIGYEVTTARGTRLHLGAPPQAPRTSQAAPSARCADCGRYRGMGNDPCGNCGALPIQVPQPAPPIAPAAIPMPIPPHPWYTTASATPDMGQRLDLAIAARSTGRVASFSPPPAPAPVAPLVHARVLLTFAAPSTLAAVQQYQADRGGVLAQPARLQPMRTMGAEARCERCHKQACGCPPPAPQTLTLVVQQKAADIARQAAADTAAGLVPLVRTVGMSGTP